MKQKYIFVYYAILIALLGCGEKEIPNKSVKKNRGNIILYTFQTNNEMFNTPARTVYSLHIAGKTTNANLYWYIYYCGMNFKEYLDSIEQYRKGIFYPFDRIVSLKILKESISLAVVLVKYSVAKNNYYEYSDVEVYLTNVSGQWKIYDNFNKKYSENK